MNPDFKKELRELEVRLICAKVHIKDAYEHEIERLENALIKAEAKIAELESRLTEYA
jgi:hypothetical protein